ncbi:unnamed protein product [Brassica oleracea var. botrytis]|uniref:Signal peptidase complex catalytic subunit SEC11 n=1 Tax=Brassica napus TaxID=3708 RepID=A0A078GW09_BRANA|nr:unnamed protein product [Brassica napus]CDY30660.1 BnaC06g10240D [Brassica napus]
MEHQALQLTQPPYIFGLPCQISRDDDVSWCANRTFKILLKNINSTKEVTHRIGAMPQELALAVPVTTRMVLNPKIEGKDDESDGWLLDRCIPTVKPSSASLCNQKKSLRVRSQAQGMIATSAFIIWKALMFVTGTESPIVVVLSASMGPGFKWVTGLISPFFLVSFPVILGLSPTFFCLLKNCVILIVHRAIKVHERENAEEEDDVLTKGAGSAEEARNNSKGGMCRCCTLLLFNLLAVWLKDFITSTHRYR